MWLLESLGILPAGTYHKLRQKAGEDDHQGRATADAQDSQPAATCSPRPDPPGLKVEVTSSPTREVVAQASQGQTVQTSPGSLDILVLRRSYSAQDDDMIKGKLLVRCFCC